MEIEDKFQKRSKRTRRVTARRERMTEARESFRRDRGNTPLGGVSLYLLFYSHKSDYLKRNVHEPLLVEKRNDLIKMIN